jgi:hypothetical protein
MTAIFRHRFVVYLFTVTLFLGFGLKTAITIGSKFSVIYMEVEDELPTEKDQNTKEEKSSRSAKKLWYFDVPNLHQLTDKEPVAKEAHNRVYLFAKIAEPFITILIEPPELV